MIGRDRVAVEYLPKLLGLSSVERERERESCKESIYKQLGGDLLADMLFGYSENFKRVGRER